MSVIAVNPVLSNQDCSQNQPRNESVVKKTEIVNKLTSRVNINKQRPKTVTKKINNCIF